MSMTDGWEMVMVKRVPAAEKPQDEKMKRLTIDIPVSLHRMIKYRCSLNGNKMTDEIRELLTKKFGG